MTTTRIGAYRNAYTSAAHPLTIRLPTVGLLAARRAAVDAAHDGHGRDQHHRDRRPERPVAREEELLADQVARIDGLVATEDHGVQVLPHQRDEHQQRARDDPGCRQRKGYPAEGPERAVAEILRRLDERPVESL